MYHNVPKILETTITSTTHYLNPVSQPVPRVLHVCLGGEAVSEPTSHHTRLLGQSACWPSFNAFDTQVQCPWFARVKLHPRHPTHKIQSCHVAWCLVTPSSLCQFLECSWCPPKSKNWLWASGLCKTAPCHFMFLTRLSTLWGEDNGVVHSSGFAKRYVPIIFLNLIERI